jgi:hypothetical protein
MKSAKETVKAIREELQAIRKAIAAIELQLSQLEADSRAPAAPPRSEQQPVKRPPGVEAWTPFRLKVRRVNPCVVELGERWEH